MKTLYFDCFSGISGDMCLGALIDLGADFEWFRNELRKLNLDGWEIKLEKVVKNGITASYVKVSVESEYDKSYDHSKSHDHTHGHSHDKSSDHSHDHSHEHSHEHSHDVGHDHTHGHTHNRNFTDIKRIIYESSISEAAKVISVDIFKQIAEAEAKVHNSTPEEVHFHEVGAVDSIIDIVGVGILIDHLKIDKIVSSVVNDGHGFTNCQHGMIPIPVPAVCEIFSKNKVKWKQVDIDKELVTPTGAAIISELAESYGLIPEMEVEKTGYGAGTRNLKIPNVLRVYLGKEKKREERITILETNIDDSTPEILGYAMNKLLSEGAKDVYFTNIQMKKNRPGVKLSVLCVNEDKAKMEKIIFSETSSIGIRSCEMDRSCLERGEKTVKTKWGEVRVKTIKFEDKEKVSAEYESARELAENKNIPLQQIYAELETIVSCKLNNMG